MAPISLQCTGVMVSKIVRMEQMNLTASVLSMAKRKLTVCFVPKTVLLQTDVSVEHCSHTQSHMDATASPDNRLSWLIIPGKHQHIFARILH